MYQLDLSDPRLALPVAIYAEPTGPGGLARLVKKNPLADRTARPPRTVAFFAPDRPGIAWLPVFDQYDGAHGQSLRVSANAQVPERTGDQPLFFILPPDFKDTTAATVPFYEYREEGSGRPVYSVDSPNAAGRSRRTHKLLGRVWRNPARSRLW